MVARVVDNETGEVTQLETQTLENVGGGVTIQTQPGSVLEGGGIALFKTAGGTQGTGSASARVTVDYDTRTVSGKREIRINRVYGGWTPLQSGVTFRSREVFYGAGIPMSGAYSATRTPTSNSFSYATGWGWVEHYPVLPACGSGPRAFTSARFGVSGMASFTLEVFVTITS